MAKNTKNTLYVKFVMYLCMHDTRIYMNFKQNWKKVTIFIPFLILGSKFLCSEVIAPVKSEVDDICLYIINFEDLTSPPSPVEQPDPASRLSKCNDHKCSVLRCSMFGSVWVCVLVCKGVCVCVYMFVLIYYLFNFFLSLIRYLAFLPNFSETY